MSDTVISTQLARPREEVFSMSPAEWWGSRDAFPGGSQVPGSSSAVTAGSVSRGVWSLAIEASEK